MGLVLKVNPSSVQNNIALEPGAWSPWIKVNWKWLNKRWQEWTLTFKESVNLNGLECVNLFRWHYIYYCGQESLRRIETVLKVNKSIMQYWGANSEMREWFLFISKTIQHHSYPSLWPNNWSWMILWRTTRPFRTESIKDVLFVIQD